MVDRTTETFRRLVSEHRKVRKQNLDNILNVVGDEKWKSSKEFMLAVTTFVYPCIFDPDQGCRETTIKIVKTLVGTGTGCVEDIAPIICVIQNRIAPKYQFMRERKEKVLQFLVNAQEVHLEIFQCTTRKTIFGILIHKHRILVQLLE
ncbi:unnamed protein product [Macrosiphum euphorbiae]|uniref:Dynein axonemal assembly factor 5 TPR repeats domain-containing protein n=1 Tax=Macrosiphum euphorbiae TaxID=13131 RepID=A0AAV0WSW6_9HEMI|nr:unnamed protein product [Macrosiphum euphorbiae]